MPPALACHCWLIDVGAVPAAPLPTTLLLPNVELAPSNAVPLNEISELEKRSDVVPDVINPFPLLLTTV